jgi:hypothetical protein
MAKVSASLSATLRNILLNLHLLDNFNFINNPSCVPAMIFWGEQTGAIAGGLEFLGGSGLVQPAAGVVKWMSIDAELAQNGNGKVEVVVNGSSDSSGAAVITTPDTNSARVWTACNLEFNQGDSLSLRTTKTPTGTNSDWRSSFAVVYKQ